jgi:hypothetical protein
VGRSLSDCLFDLSGLSERSLLNETGGVSIHQCHIFDAIFSIVVKSIDPSADLANLHLERNVETLMNLRSPCIAGPIGFLLPSPLQAVKTGDHVCEVDSYRESESRCSAWTWSAVLPQSWGAPRLLECALVHTELWTHLRMRLTFASAGPPSPRHRQPHFARSSLP